MSALLENLAELLRYPESDYNAHLDKTLRLAAGTPCGEALERLRAEIETLSLGALQERYTRTFDLSPLCASSASIACARTSRANCCWTYWSTLR